MRRYVTPNVAIYDIAPIALLANSGVNDAEYGLGYGGEDEEGNLERYNIFSTRMLVRCDADGKLYLYDLVRTKKETSKPHEQ